MIRLALHDLATMLGDQSPPQPAKKLDASEPRDEGQWLEKTKELYYDSSEEASFGSYRRILSKAKTLPGAEPSAVKPWLEQQDAYTLHKPVRKRFPRNPYTVNNIMDLWEADLVDVQSLAKYCETNYTTSGARLSIEIVC